VYQCLEPSKGKCLHHDKYGKGTCNVVETCKEQRNKQANKQTNKQTNNKTQVLFSMQKGEGRKIEGGGGGDEQYP
jgi:hypothetical protein